VIFALIVPLALMTVLNLIMGDLDTEEVEPVTVAVTAPADDELAAVLPDALAQLDEPDVTLVERDAADVRATVENDEAGMGLIVPEHFTQTLRSGAGLDVEVIEGNGDEISMTVVAAVLDAVLDQ